MAIPSITKEIRSWRPTYFHSTEPVVFCYFAALMLHLPILQQYVYMRYSESYGFNYEYKGLHEGCTSDLLLKNSSNYELQKKVQSSASFFQLGFILIEAIPSLVVCLFVGPWSDRFGRRPVIIMAVLGSVLESSIVLMTMYLDLPVYTIYLGAFFNGIGGYYTCVLCAALSYIADRTEASKRSVRIAIFEGVIFFACMTSTIISGHLLTKEGFKAAYWLVFALHITACFYAIFFLPESLPNVSNHRAVTRKDLLLYPKEVWKVIRKQRPGRWLFYVILPANILTMSLTLGTSTVYMLYLQNSPFCWGSIAIGYILSTRFLIMGLGAVFAMKVLKQFMSEVALVWLAFVSYCASIMGLAFAETKTGVYLTTIGLLFIGFASPVFRGIMSNAVEDEEQGLYTAPWNSLDFVRHSSCTEKDCFHLILLFGIGIPGRMFSIAASLEMISFILGGALFGIIYPLSISINFPGLTFIINGALCSFPLAFVIVYQYKIRKQSQFVRVELEDMEGLVLSEEISNDNDDDAEKNCDDCEELEF